MAPKRGRVRSPDPEVELWDNDPILKPGEVALFGTRRDADHGWHTIVAQPFADRRIRSRAEGDRVVREFKPAHETSRAP